MDSALKRRLRARGQGLDVTVSVGRRGLDAAVVEEVTAQLRTRRLVKVKLQDGATGGEREAADQVASELARATGSELVERRGRTVLLYRPGGGRG